MRCVRLRRDGGTRDGSRRRRRGRRDRLLGSLTFERLSPLDVDLIAASVRDTGRAVVVHEAPRTLGLGAEVTALIVEHAFDFLEAPVARVTGWDVPYPPAALEQHYLPSVERIADAIRTRWRTDGRRAGVRDAGPR